MSKLSRRNKLTKPLNTKEKAKCDGTGALLRPIYFIKYYSIVISILNLALPTIHGVLGFKSIWNWMLCLVYGYARANSSGKCMEYSIPIGWILSIRTLEFAVHLLPMFDEINLIVFFALCVCDALLLIFMAVHRNNYEFEVEHDSR